MKKAASITSGLAGSVALTIFHQVMKTNVSHAPRLDKLGMEAMETTLNKAGLPSTTSKDLYYKTLAGDIAANAGYYSLVGLSPKNSITTGALLGAVAGIGAVGLPSKMGLINKYTNATQKTKLLTVALYLSAGLLAGVVYKFMAKKNVQGAQ